MKGVLMVVAMAWVLWNEGTYAGLGAPPSTSWVLISASPHYAQCEEERIAQAQNLLRVREDDTSGNARVTRKEIGSMIVVSRYFKDGGAVHLTYRLVCLPDTIDPRGPRP